MACGGNKPKLIEDAVEQWYAFEPDEGILLNDLLYSKPELDSFLKKELSNKNASLIVHHLAKASSCKLQASRQNVLELLTYVADSPLLGTRGMQLLGYMIGNDTETHPFECLVSDFLTVLRNMSLSMPSLVTTPQIIGFIDWLTQIITDNINTENKESFLERVFELKSEIMKKIAARATGKKDRRKQFEDSMRPPESFRTIPVMPVENDILYKTDFLRRNKAYGKYNDLEHYLDVQFRLYREDCISPLRDVFEEFVTKTKENKKYFRLDGGRIYRDIQILKGTSTSLEHGEVYVVELDKDHCQRIHWRNSKRLIYGSLLLLSFDKFESILFAVVSDLDRDTVKETGQFKVQIFKTHQDQQIPRETNGIILEATSAYFESYHHVLSTMQTINVDTLPFQKYIVHCSSDVDMPLYLSLYPETTFDLQPIMSNNKIQLSSESNHRLEYVIRRSRLGLEDHCRIKLLDVDHWPSKDALNMDESQRQAFISALTKEFVLIQGPPGTGKTYLGLQITKALLHNKDEWKETKTENLTRLQITRNRKNAEPCILIVCFTNHALDQFVEGIIDFLPAGKLTDIVRIGSQCKTPNVDKHSIKNLRHNFRRQRRAADVIEEADMAKLNIKRCRGLLKSLQDQNVVLGYHEIRKVMSEDHAMGFGKKQSDTKWFDWLGVLIENWFMEVHKRYKQKNYKKKVPRKYNEGSDQDFLNVVEEADYQYNERSLDEDTEFVFDANTIGKDVLAQLHQALEATTDEKCREILQDEANNTIQQLKSGEIASEILMQSEINIWNISTTNRWKMYRYWLKKYVEMVKENLMKLENEFNYIFQQYKQARMDIDEEIMKEASVIAMTTTGAAKYRDALRKIGPKITIIEEAAEVPEAHIITAINPKCDHVILIGDHKQLEPKPAVRELAVKYNLSLSLFERMLNNGLHYHCLERQHRMRPEISELVRHMYPVLHDNENVLEYDDVKGIRANLFFIDHRNDEQYNEDGKSFSNEHEAEYLKELCDYLLKQGYKSSEITIIAAYTGQMFCIRNKMPRSRFEGVNICVLDNYQGEENEIILLSLVRSNQNGEIGFLSRENRICVALSRAKKGLYIIGNSSTLTSNSKHWHYILDKIKERKVLPQQECGPDNPGTLYKSFGTALPLFCQNHPKDDGILASCPDDFSKAPDGGCEKPCERRLLCGHACRYRCHPFDPEHEEYTCGKLCLKRCNENHTCQKKCHFPEDCACSILMKRLLRCDHTVTLECWKDPEQHQCRVKVIRNLDCGHSVVLECCIEPKTYKCKEIITEERTDCGHKFERKCFQKDYESTHECDVKVTKMYPDCGHEFERECHDIDYERRHKCMVKVLKTYTDCGHSKLVACSIDLKYKKCDFKIKKILECEHDHLISCFEQHYGYTYFGCTEKCSKVCVNSHVCENKCHHPLPCRCEVKIEKKIPRCGHNMMIECGQLAENFFDCDVTVDMTLELCGHKVHTDCGRKFKINDASPLRRRVMEKALKCNEMVEHVIQKCGHLISIECWRKHQIKDVEDRHQRLLGYARMSSMTELQIGNDIQCKTLVNVDLACGHTKEVECFKKDFTRTMTSECKIEVEVVLKQCGHRIKTECSDRHMTALHTTCQETISYRYPNCGHETHIKCFQNPQYKAPLSHHQRFKGRRPTHSLDDDIPPCSLIVVRTLDCGHEMSVACNIKDPVCDKSCNDILVCGHKCLEKCKICKSMMQHKTCKMSCEKVLVCGHLCENAKCLQCALCSKQCTVSCDHSSCKLKCIDMCKPCNQPCTWICPHRKCTKLCSEPCDRSVCTETCPTILPCGHQCPGFCGEPCPTACILCDSDKYIGLRKNTQDSKIVTLIDCGHSFECEYLDDYMSKYALNLISRCPSCQAVFHRHPRYDSILKTKRKYMEDVKRQLLHIARPMLKYPLINLWDIPDIETYVRKYLTYLQIIGYIEKDRNIRHDVQLMKEKGENILQCIGRKTNNFQNWMDVSNQMFLIHVHWILYLCSKNENLLGETFEILEKNDSIESKQHDEESTNSKDNGTENLKTPTDLSENNDENELDNMETTHVLLSSSSASINVKTNEDSGNKKVDDSAEKNDKTKSIRRFTTKEITDRVWENARRGDHGSAKLLLNLLIPYIEDEAHFSDAMDYPQLKTAIGVHSTDWSICSKGHVTPSVINEACLTCSDKGQPLWVYTEQSRRRRKNTNVQKYNDTVNSENINQQEVTVSRSSEQFPLDDVWPRRGRGKGRANYNQRRPYSRQGPVDGDSNWPRNTQPNKNTYEQRSQDTNWRRTGSADSSFEPQPDIGRNENRGRGNRRSQRQRGAANDRNQAADQHRPPTDWMTRSDSNTSMTSVPRGRGGRGGANNRNQPNPFPQPTALMSWSDGNTSRGRGRGGATNNRNQAYQFPEHTAWTSRVDGNTSTVNTQRGRAGRGRRRSGRRW